MSLGRIHGRKTKYFTMMALAVVVAFSGLQTASANENIASAWKRFKGKLIISDRSIPTDYNSDKQMIAQLKRMNVKSLTQENAGWTFSFIGFMKKSPKAKGINLVFYKRNGKKREYVSNRQITINPKDKVVAASIAVSEEDGLEAGSTYEVILARMVNGKEHVYAKTLIQLK